MAGEVAGIRVIVPGTAAGRLLECLRRRAKPFGVTIEGNEPDLIAKNATGSVIDLRDFLVAKLDECESRQAASWRDYLAIQHR